MRLFRHELRYELLLYSRSRELAFFTFLLPMILFLLLGFAYGDEEIQGVKGSDYLLTGTLGYGVVATAFAGLAIVLVIRREEGILKRLRSTPLPAPTYLVAVLATTMVAFLIQAVCIVVVGMAAFDASFPSHLVSFVLALILGAASFAALGVGLTGAHEAGGGGVGRRERDLLPDALPLRARSSSATRSPSSCRRSPPCCRSPTSSSSSSGSCTRETRSGIAWATSAVLAAWGLAGALFAVRRFRWTPSEG